MVTGLPHFIGPSNICVVPLASNIKCHSPKGKARRARQHLEIVHYDICGPINPISNRAKRYIPLLLMILAEKHGLISYRKNLKL